MSKNDEAGGNWQAWDPSGGRATPWLGTGNIDSRPGQGRSKPGARAKDKAGSPPHRCRAQDGGAQVAPGLPL